MMKEILELKKNPCTLHFSKLQLMPTFG